MMLASNISLFRTLIVEDDPDACEILTKGLERHDFITECVTTVGQALIKLETKEYAAIVLDLSLPDASGTVILRRVRRGKLPVQIAVLTGIPDLSRYADLVRYPPDVVFKKPIDLPALLQWLDDARRKHEAENE